MYFGAILQYATLLTIVIGIWGVAISVMNNRREINATIYLDISLRLQNLYKSIPGDKRYAHVAGLEPEVDDAVIVAILLDFLNLSQCGFTLHNSGFITGSLWHALDSEIREGLKLPAAHTHWPQLRKQFTHNPQFLQYVEKVQSTRKR